MASNFLQQCTFGIIKTITSLCKNDIIEVSVSKTLESQQFRQGSSLQAERERGREWVVEEENKKIVYYCSFVLPNYRPLCG